MRTAPYFRILFNPSNEIAVQFDEKPDLVVLYSRSSSLCNFFPWNLDPATFVLAGPPANLLPLSVVRAVGQYNRSVQRF
jgi:hypothetical protein